MLVLGGAFPGNNDSTRPLSVLFNKAGEYFWRNLLPLYHAEHLQIVEILGFSPVNCSLQMRTQIFKY